MEEFAKAAGGAYTRGHAVGATFICILLLLFVMHAAVCQALSLLMLCIHSSV